MEGWREASRQTHTNVNPPGGGSTASAPSVHVTASYCASASTNCDRPRGTARNGCRAGAEVPCSDARDDEYIVADMGRVRPAELDIRDASVSVSVGAPPDSAPKPTSAAAEANASACNCETRAKNCRCSVVSAARRVGDPGESVMRAGSQHATRGADALPATPPTRRAGAADAGRGRRAGAALEPATSGSMAACTTAVRCRHTLDTAAASGVTPRRSADAFSSSVRMQAGRAGSAATPSLSDASAAMPEPWTTRCTTGVSGDGKDTARTHRRSRTTARSSRVGLL